MVPVGDAVSVAGFIAFENWTVSVFVLRFSAAAVTDGPVDVAQLIWYVTSVSGETVPSVPTSRMRATWKPGCPERPTVKVNALSNPAMVVVVNPSMLRRTRAPAALAVPLIVAEVRQPCCVPALVMIGAVPGAVVAAVKLRMNGAAGDWPARSFKGCGNVEG